MSAQIVHGGALDKSIARYGGRRQDWLDLSTGINPDPWPGSGLCKVIDKLNPDAWYRLPDTDAEENLIRAARRAYGVSANQHIVVANGTQAIIELLPRVLSCEEVAIMGPTYQEHELSWMKAGRHVSRIGHEETLPLTANGLVVVNPNNPDGRVHRVSHLEGLADELALRHGWLIVDEAFCDCDPQASMISSNLKNVIVLRSFGKFFGLAGLRLGFAIAPAKVVTQIENMIGPWAVSGPAMEIGASALGDTDWIAKTRRRLPEKAERLAEVLSGSGLEIIGSNPLFVLARHPDAKKIHRELCAQYILTRHFPDQADRLRFGLCPDERSLKRLAQALAKVVLK